MNQEMVTYAKGRPPKKVREKDSETDYEECIYGEPPQDVDLLRLVGDEVVRVETINASGEKIIRNEKEVNLQSNRHSPRNKNSRPIRLPRLLCAVPAKSLLLHRLSNLDNGLGAKFLY